MIIIVITIFAIFPFFHALCVRVEVLVRCVVRGSLVTGRGLPARATLVGIRRLRKPDGEPRFINPILHAAQLVAGNI